MSNQDRIIVEEVDMLTEPDDTILPAVIRSELNFLQFPFFALSWHGLKKKTKTEYRFIEERNGEKVELLWRVTANAEYGYPTPFDHKVARAIDAVIQDQIGENRYLVENPIPFSIYYLARLMELGSDGGQVYKGIKESIERIVATTVKSEGAYYLRGEKRWLEDIFHIYDRAVFKGKELPDGSVAETNYLWLSDPYLKNINAQHVAPLDYRYMASLKSDLASRLYEVLGRKFYGLPRGQDHLQIGYLRLCEVLPLKPQRYLSRIRQILDPAHNELIDTGFLRTVKYRRARDDKSFVLVYYLGKRAQAERNGSLTRRMHGERQLSLPLDRVEQSERSELAQALEDRGVSRYTAEGFAREYDSGYIREKMAMFDDFKEAGSTAISLNSGGWLRRAIEQDWTLSDEQRARHERQREAQKNDDRQERWMVRREELIEQELARWDEKSIEERFEGYLGFHFWNTNPTPAEKEAKLNELAEQYSDEDMKRRWLEGEIPKEPPDDFE